MAEKSFDQLSEEFNAASDAWNRGVNVTAAALTMRFNILLRHCAENDDHKFGLVSKLLETTLQRIGQLTPATCTAALSEPFMQQYITVFDALAAPEATSVLPEKTPRVLAGVALDVLDLRNNPGFSTTERETYTAFSGVLLSYADKFAAAIKKRNGENPAPQTIPLPKQITLKKPAAAQ